MKIQAQWLKPIIPAAQEAEIRRIMVQSQMRKSLRDPISTNGWVHWRVPVILAMWKT
jgi:hypothetical protein